MRYLGLAAVLACGACIPAQPVVRTTIETRDPLAVDVVRILPWNGAVTHIAHAPSGALVASSPGEPDQIVVSHAGTIVLDPDMTVDMSKDPVATWMFYDAAGEGSHGTPKPLSQLVVSTPRSNVTRVTEWRGPHRGNAGLLIGLGTVFLGSAVASTYGAATTPAPGEIAGFVLLTTLFTGLAAYGTIEGFYRIFGTEENRIVYRGY